jgi:hypothetical protein
VRQEPADHREAGSGHRPFEIAEPHGKRFQLGPVGLQADSIQRRGAGQVESCRLTKVANDALEGTGEPHALPQQSRLAIPPPTEHCMAPAPAQRNRSQRLHESDGIPARIKVGSSLPIGA